MSLQYIKFNKPHLKEHSKLSSLFHFGLYFMLACSLTWMSFWLLQISWQTHLLNQKYDREGIKVDGYVSGFHFQGSKGTGKFATRAGDYPIVTFETPKEQIQLTPRFGAPLSKAQQYELLHKKMKVVYLKNEPTLGRVVMLHSSSFWFDAVFGVVFLAGALFYFCKSFKFLSHSE